MPTTHSPSAVRVRRFAPARADETIASERALHSRSVQVISALTPQYVRGYLRSSHPAIAQYLSDNVIHDPRRQQDLPVRKRQRFVGRNRGIELLDERLQGLVRWQVIALHKVQGIASEIANVLRRGLDRSDELRKVALVLFRVQLDEHLLVVVR